MHRSAVVAEHDVEFREQRGELPDAEALAQRHEMTLRVASDRAHEGLFAWAGDEEHLRAQFIL